MPSFGPTTRSVPSLSSTARAKTLTSARRYVSFDSRIFTASGDSSRGDSATSTRRLDLLSLPSGSNGPEPERQSEPLREGAQVTERHDPREESRICEPRSSQQRQAWACKRQRR